ncbi:septum formation initiator family protein [Candidatus Parcubacteria bacterium]|nr:septum formation initiator family protein [Candidatus Parcubacteria bacterium]
MDRLRKLRIRQIIGALLVVYLSVILIQTVQRNYRLKREIGQLEQRIEALARANEELEYKIQYYQTDSFKEKEARSNLGLQAPGEGVIILPKEAKPAEPADQEEKLPQPEPNFKQWWTFLFG